MIILVKPEILEMTAISSTEMKEELKRIQKRDGELNFRANKTMEYLDHFKLLKKSDAKSLFDELLGLGISRLRDEHIIKIIDLLPQSVDDLKVIISGFNVTLPKESMSQIVDAVKKVV